MNFVLATVALLAFEPGPATATANSTAAAPVVSRSETQGATEGAERRICRRIDTSESRMSRRLCLTAREWRDYNRN